MVDETTIIIGLGIGTFVVSVVTGYVSGLRASQNQLNELRKELETKMEARSTTLQSNIDTLQDRVHGRLERIHERISDQRELLRKDLHEKMSKVDVAFKAFDQGLRSFELEMRALASEIANFKSRHNGGK